MRGLVLATEIGGTKSQVALGTQDGTIVEAWRGTVDVQAGGEGIRGWLGKHVPIAMHKAQAMNQPVAAIGVGFGGPIDTAAGCVLRSCQIQGWDDFPLRDWLQKEFGVPAVVHNDSNAAAWGEYRSGIGKGSKVFFYTNIGSGIGGGVVIDGQMYDGQGYGAGEMGQTLIPDWTANASGAERTLEQLCSGWAIEKRIQSGKIPENSCLWELCGGRQERITCAHLGQAALREDRFSLAEIDQVARGMGMGIVNMLSLLNPDCIAIGGGVSKLGDVLISRIRGYAHAHDFVSSHERYRIEKCVLGDAVVLVGAILLAADQISD